MNDSTVEKVSLTALKKMRALLSHVLQEYFWKYDIDKKEDRIKILIDFQGTGTFTDMILDYLAEAEDDMIYLRRALKESPLSVAPPP